MHFEQLLNSNWRQNSQFSAQAKATDKQLMTYLNGNSDILRIYYQPMSGVRTKLKSIYIKSSHLEYDIFVFVETWLTREFYDAEIFDTNLYNLYRKDRDPFTTGCKHGGGVLIAVKVSLKGLYAVAYFWIFFVIFFS